QGVGGNETGPQEVRRLAAIVRREGRQWQEVVRRGVAQSAPPEVLPRLTKSFGIQHKPAGHEVESRRVDVAVVERAGVEDTRGVQVALVPDGLFEFGRLEALDQLAARLEAPVVGRAE